MSRKSRLRNFQGRDFRAKRRPDVLSKKGRSTLMSRIRSSGSNMETSFVATLRSRCDEMFEINDRSVLGKPDIAFRRLRVCVFLDSDFWHGWQYPRWKHLLKSAFWRTKIERNRQRDKEVTRTLRRQAWTVLRFWEHNLRGGTDAAVASVVGQISRLK